MCCWNLIKKALGLSKKGAGGGQDDIDKAEYTQTGKEDDSTIVIPGKLKNQRKIQKESKLAFSIQKDNQRLSLRYIILLLSKKLNRFL